MGKQHISIEVCNVSAKCVTCDKFAAQGAQIKFEVKQNTHLGRHLQVTGNLVAPCVQHAKLHRGTASFHLYSEKHTFIATIKVCNGIVATALKPIVGIKIRLKKEPHNVTVVSSLN